jgi:hypothetical protein
MDVAFQAADACVIDNLVDSAVYESVEAMVKTCGFQRVPPSTAIWSARDVENPLEGAAEHVLLVDCPITRFARSRQAFTPRHALCPTGSVLDDVLYAIERSAGLAPFIGRARQDWVGLFGRTYCYPPGSRAPWHRDEGPYAGAFIYYVNSLWDRADGGDLVLSTPDAPQRRIRALANRLVILNVSTLHCVAPVVGKHARYSLSGFFATPQALLASVLHTVAPSEHLSADAVYQRRATIGDGPPIEASAREVA